MIRASLKTLQKLFQVSQSSDAVTTIEGVVTDTRKECAGALFIALKGEQFDGHDYVAKAYEKGAVVALVSTPVDCAIEQIVVADTLTAYGQLAHYWRLQVNPTVIAITGSNGKTTVKEMLSSIMTKMAQTHSTKGNFNNEIGVPQTLCELDQGDRFAIIEMGANHAGEIKRLTQIAQPDIVYVNNASATHLEGFGSLAGVQKAKGEIYRYAPSEAIAIINADDEAAAQWMASSTTQHIKTISAARAQPAIMADIVSFNQDGVLQIETENERFSLNLSVKGAHNESNALAAASLALAVNTPCDVIVAGLEGFSSVNGRLNFIQGWNGCTLIDDSYNANPTSFKAGIDVLCNLQGEAWLAMGDMGELGENAQQQHDEVVDYAKKSGVKALFAKGIMSKQAARLMDESASTFDDFDSMGQALKEVLDHDINLLVKGSRSAQMDILVSQLKGGMH